MDDNKVPKMIFLGMLNLNLIIILYIAMIITVSLLGYAQENTALSFLQQVRSMPFVPWKIPVLVVLLFGSLVFFLWIQAESSLLVYLKIGMEIIVSIMIIYVLNFSYTGIIFLILADVIRRLPKAKGKFTAIGIICAFYLLTDYNLFSGRYNITSLDTYLVYYRSDVRSIMLAVINIMNSLNMLIFIIYTILLMRIQMSEKERILQLNEKLNHANEELQQVNRQMEEYSRESIKNAETKERNRLAREIHDTLGHTLTGIITGLDACVTLMDMAPEAVKEQLKVIADVARNGMTDVRRSVKALRPDALEKMELEKALVQMMEETKRASNIEIDYCCTASLKHFNKDEEEIIYRIVQESITNAIRHGKASRIGIAISMEYNIINIWIKDNGIGCTHIEKGFGLHHMEERLGMLHGSLKCFVDNGFVLEASIPIRWGEEGN
ncbi:MAG: sensor histidine kinase [Lachnospiraceae bacterium]|nr:sensor histidine kinase [Lachnospiraceae bacterium]